MKTFPRKLILPGLITHVVIILAVGFTKYKENQINESIQSLQISFENTNNRIKDFILLCYKISSNEYYSSLEKKNPNKSINRNLLFQFENECHHIKDLCENLNIETKNYRELDNLVNEKIALSEEIIYQLDQNDKRSVITRLIKSASLCEDIERKAIQIKLRIDEKKSEEITYLKKREQLLSKLYNVFFSIAFLLLFVVFLVLQNYIRDNKKIIENLNQSAQLLQGIIDHSPSPISVKGLDGRYIFANNKFDQFIEKDVKVITGKSDTELFSKEIADKKMEKDLEVIKSKSIIKFEENLKYKGETISFINTVFPILNSIGNLDAIAAISTDISEKSKADLELFDREKTMRLYFENCPGALIIIDEHSKIISANPGTTLIFGWSVKEMIGQYMPSLMMNPENWDKHQKGIKRFIETGRGPVLEGRLELTAMKKDKQEINIELSVKEFKIDNQEFFIGLIQDISQRKNKERESEENLSFLNSIVENLPNMVFIKDAEKLQFVRINKAGEKILGLSRDEIIGKSDYDFFPKNQADFFTQSDRNVIDKKIVLDVPEEMINTKFGTRWLHTRKISITNNSNTPHFLLGISEDITDKKNIEKERDDALKQLKESEFRLELVLSNIGEGVVMTNESQEILIYNETAAEILNTEDSKVLARWSLNFQFYYPDGKQIYPAQMLPVERAIRGQSTDDQELLLQEVKTGEFKRIKVNGRPIQDEQGKIVAAVATIKDITQIKEIEKKLEESELKYRQIIGFKREKNEEKT